MLTLIRRELNLSMCSRLRQIPKRLIREAYAFLVSSLQHRYLYSDLLIPIKFTLSNPYGGKEKRFILCPHCRTMNKMQSL